MQDGLNLMYGLCRQDGFDYQFSTEASAFEAGSVQDDAGRERTRDEDAGIHPIDTVTVRMTWDL